MSGGASAEQELLEEEHRAPVYAALRRLHPFEAWIICERYGLAAQPLGKVTGHTSRRRAEGKNKRGREPAPVSSGGSPARWRRPSQSIHARTYGAIGEDCGLSVYRIRQIEKEALENLRALLSADIS
jgi:DNA-directed RNA polymerase sigma subunit (sigma70/sigma32)